MKAFELNLKTRVLFGEGCFARLGALAADLGFRRTLIVSDAAIVETGLVERARKLLHEAGVQAAVFSGFAPNPDSAMVETGRALAAAEKIDSLIGLGGGSSLDCAKGINFVLTGGGTMQDYWGLGKARRPMLPGIGVPTTAGTGSEAQSAALIADAKTHAKMACVDPRAAFAAVILDPALTLTQPPAVAAAAGYNAISHAVESFVTRRRTNVSDLFARDAWRLLENHYERVLADPDDLESRGAMLLGAYEAGVAIEQSMLGATHACANSLTAAYGTDHAVAIGVMLPHVVRWNAPVVGDRYAELLGIAGRNANRSNAGPRLAERLAALARAGGLPSTLTEAGAARADISTLAENAATQWTGTFNPRPFDAEAARVLYENAF